MNERNSEYRVGVNVRPATCGGCGIELAPSEGQRWQNEMPPWAKDARRFTCDRCWKLYTLWYELLPLAWVHLKQIQERICNDMPGWPIPVAMGDEVYYQDQRSWAQEQVKLILQSSGIWFAWCAFYTARWMDEDDLPEDAMDLVTKVTDITKQVVERMNKLMEIN